MRSHYRLIRCLLWAPMLYEALLFLAVDINLVNSFWWSQASLYSKVASP